jgi:Flp pilus assembly protein TadD
LVQLDRYDEAQRSLEAAVSLEPRDAHSHYLLGYTHGEAKRYRPAEACLREALRLSPEEPVYLRALAELLVESSKRQGASSDEAAAASSSGSGEALAEALRLAGKAVELGPERASNHITLGFVSSACGDRIAARACYQRALVIEPNNALAWNNLGCVDLAQGRPMQALERFRESLRLDPEGSVARENLKLVQPGQRPATVYKDVLAFERQLVIEVWDKVLFRRTGYKRHVATAFHHAARSQPVSAPLSPKGFLRNYLFPKKLEDDPRLHAAALMWATEFRTVGLMVWKMPQLIVWMGASVGLLRLGPAGIALSLSSNAATYLLNRRPLRIRYEHYKEEVARIKAIWTEQQEAWLRGDIERTQRDAAIDRLLDDFARYVEALRERLYAEEEPD